MCVLYSACLSICVHLYVHMLFACMRACARAHMCVCVCHTCQPYCFFRLANYWKIVLASRIPEILKYIYRLITKMWHSVFSLHSWVLGGKKRDSVMSAQLSYIVGCI